MTLEEAYRRYRFDAYDDEAKAAFRDGVAVSEDIGLLQEMLEEMHASHDFEALAARIFILDPHSQRWWEQRLLLWNMTLFNDEEYRHCDEAMKELGTRYPESLVYQYFRTYACWGEALPNAATEEWVRQCTDAAALFRIARRMHLTIDQFELLINRVVELEPENERALGWLLICSCPPDSVRERATAAATLRKLEHPTLGTLTALVHDANNSSDDAQTVIDAQRLLDRIPDDETALKLAFVALHRMGRLEEAIEYAKRLLDAQTRHSAPDIAWTKEALAALESGGDFPQGFGYGVALQRV